MVGAVTNGEEHQENRVDDEERAARAARFAQIQVSEATGLHLELDEEKRAALRACLDKGTLSIEVTELSLTSGGRLMAGYIYD